MSPHSEFDFFHLSLRMWLVATVLKAMVDKLYSTFEKLGLSTGCSDAANCKMLYTYDCCFVMPYLDYLEVTWS